MDIFYAHNFERMGVAAPMTSPFSPPSIAKSGALFRRRRGELGGVHKGCRSLAANSQPALTGYLIYHHTSPSTQTKPPCAVATGGLSPNYPAGLNLSVLCNDDCRRHAAVGEANPGPAQREGHDLSAGLHAAQGRLLSRPLSSNTRGLSRMLSGISIC